MWAWCPVVGQWENWSFRSRVEGNLAASPILCMDFTSKALFYPSIRGNCGFPQSHQLIKDIRSIPQGRFRDEKYCAPWWRKAQPREIIAA